MSNDDLRLAFIGCGGIALRHLQAMNDLVQRDRGGFVVTAACDANIDNAEKLATEVETLLGNRPTVYVDYTEMLAAESLDGVDICLPHGLHHSVSIDCMEAGVDVLCEKPIGVTIRAGKLMAEAAERTGRILSIAVPHRRQPGQRTAEWVLNRSGLMGTPITFFHNYTRPPIPVDPNQPVPARVAWRRDRLMSGGGMTLDSGFHYCDSIRYLFGEVDKVYAEMRELKSGAPVSVQEKPEDSIYVTLSFTSGLVGSWSWSVAAPGAQSARVMFFGSEGSLEDTTPSRFRIFHLFERRPEQRESGQLVRADGATYQMEELEQLYRETLDDAETEFLFPGGATDGFAIEIREFIELLNGERSQPEVGAQEGIRSLALGDAIYESAFTGDVVQVKDVLSGKRRIFQEAIDEHWGL